MNKQQSYIVFSILFLIFIVSCQPNNSTKPQNDEDKISKLKKYLLSVEKSDLPDFLQENYGLFHENKILNKNKSEGWLMFLDANSQKGDTRIYTKLLYNKNLRPILGFVKTHSKLEFDDTGKPSGKSYFLGIVFIGKRAGRWVDITNEVFPKEARIFLKIQYDFELNQYNFMNAKSGFFESNNLIINTLNFQQDNDVQPVLRMSWDGNNFQITSKQVNPNQLYNETISGFNLVSGIRNYDLNNDKSSDKILFYKKETSDNKHDFYRVIFKFSDGTQKVFDNSTGWDAFFYNQYETLFEEQSIIKNNLNRWNDTTYAVVSAIDEKSFLVMLKGRSDEKCGGKLSGFYIKPDTITNFINKNVSLRSIKDLNNDNHLDIVVDACCHNNHNNLNILYSPIQVFSFDKEKPYINETLTKQYNLIVNGRYAGPDCTENIIGIYDMISESYIENDFGKQPNLKPGPFKAIIAFMQPNSDQKNILEQDFDEWTYRLQQLEKQFEGSNVIVTAVFNNFKQVKVGYENQMPITAVDISAITEMNEIGYILITNNKKPVFLAYKPSKQIILEAEKYFYQK